MGPQDARPLVADERLVCGATPRTAGLAASKVDACFPGILAGEGGTWDGHADSPSPTAETSARGRVCRGGSKAPGGGRRGTDREKGGPALMALKPPREPREALRSGKPGARVRLASKPLPPAGRGPWRPLTGLGHHCSRETPGPCHRSRKPRQGNKRARPISTNRPALVSGLLAPGLCRFVLRPSLEVSVMPILLLGNQRWEGPAGVRAAAAPAAGGLTAPPSAQVPPDPTISFQ